MTLYVWHTENQGKLEWFYLILQQIFCFTKRRKKVKKVPTVNQRNISASLQKQEMEFLKIYIA